jgi:hypothetical protein
MEIVQYYLPFLEDYRQLRLLDRGRDALSWGIGGLCNILLWFFN